MRQHERNTQTLYEYAIENAKGERAFTLWFMQRKPSLNKVYRSVIASIEEIRKFTNCHDVQWNGDGTITAGEYTGKMTGNTLLQARGYNEQSYR